MNKYKRRLEERKSQNSNCIDLRCVECGEEISTSHTQRWGGKHHTLYGGQLDTYFFCDKEECRATERIKTPKEMPTCVILEDDINYVKARYQYGTGNATIENWLRCHWTSKGRFITIKNRRVYIND